MNHFNVKCPYCVKNYRIKNEEVNEFFDSHVFWCKKERLPSSWLSLKKWQRIISEGGLPLVDGIFVRGHALLKVFRGDELINVQIAHNLVVNDGRALIIDRFQTGSPATADYQAVGTGSTAANAADTTLGTEIGTRVQGALSQVPNAYTDRLISTFNAGNGTGAITEAGRFNASTSGVLYSRLVFSVVNKGASDSLQITHDVTD